MWLRDDTPEEERIGSRDLTEWHSRAGQALVRLVLSLARWAAARWVLVVTALVGGAVSIGLTAVSTEVYEAVVESDGVAALDQPVLEQAVQWRSPELNEAVTWFTDVGGTVGMPLVATAAVLAMVVAWRSWTPIVLTLIAAAGSLAMTVTGKELIGRARPPLDLAVPPYEESPSFPSGHTLNATVVIGVLVYLVLRRLESSAARVATVAAAALFVVAMGLSRVFLGHHWLTDVFVGWSLGLAWLGAVVTAHRLFLTVRRAREGSQASSSAHESPERVNPSRS